VPADHIPSLSSRRLGRALQALREQRRLSCDQAASAAGHEAIWLIQVEVGQDQITVEELRGLLDLYAVGDDDVRRDLVDLVGLAGGPSWVRRHAGWLDELERDFIVLESEASAVRAFGIPLIPELLRTEGYARAFFTAVRLPGAVASVDQQMDLLLSRQRHEGNGTRRRLHAVLDETAILQPVGGEHTMRGQLRHLVEQAAHDDTVLQLIPREVGAHPGLDGSFHILDFADPHEPSVSISHSALGPLVSYVDLDDHFHKLEQVALSPADSLFFIEQALDEL
jgi:hypothetical protein